MGTRVDRRYRVRFALPGAEEITSETVDFILDVASDMSTVPVVTGSIAHPIRASTTIRPFTLQCIDHGGSFLDRITLAQEADNIPSWFSVYSSVERRRWRAMGRLIDVQYQLATDDPEADPWTTYGTGRCSNFNEGNGPGKFNVEVSDESWKARKHVAVFENNDTIQLWPAMARPGHLDVEPISMARVWRGKRKGLPGTGHVDDAKLIVNFEDENVILTRIFLDAFTDLGTQTGIADLDFSASMFGGIIVPKMVRWIRSDIKDELDFHALTPTEGNFEHLRLHYGPADDMHDYEIVSFGTMDDELDDDERSDEILEGLEEPVQFMEPGGVRTHMYVWVKPRRDDEGNLVSPPDNGELAQRGFLWAPTAPPSDDFPLLIGVNNPDHEWGTDGGYIHIADLHRRAWDKMGIRYDPDNLDTMEADKSLAVLAPFVGDDGKEPEKWLEKARQNVGVIALRDRRGRMKLVDNRTQAEIDLTTLTRVNASNHLKLRQKVLGRETINIIDVTTTRFEYVTPDTVERELARVDGLDPEGDVNLAQMRLTDHVLDYKGDTIKDQGERRHDYHARFVLSPRATDAEKENLVAQDRGQLWEDVREPLMAGWLLAYQDGLERVTWKWGKTEADDHEEGDLAVINHDETKSANPEDGARTGERVVRIISITRHPHESPCEAIVTPEVREIPEFEETCPEE